jgi:pseudouridine-5'-phosphate glycosidase
MIELADAVRDALAQGRAVVALESTLIAHGLPFPDNVELGLALEAQVAAAGAVAATIAVLDGRCRVGLTREEIERIGRAGMSLAKAGAADLAPICARGGSAATTVGGTLVIAARAGIRVFATGGIGGVHAGDTGDVSSDLVVLSREPVAVVSSGAKAFLDLRRTLEVLETLGVLVVGHRTRELPAFYSRHSGLPLEHHADDPAELAAILRARWALGLAGVLIAHPIAADAELDPAQLAAAVAGATGEAQRRGITGKALTPFVLAELARTTGGATVRANRTLATGNAAAAAAIAIALGGARA